jgi:putative hydrolase of the HAD superfamily
MIPDSLTHLVRPLSPVPTACAPKGRLRKPVRAVLFDVYGTLLISGAGEISTDAEHAGENAGLDRFIEAFRLPLSAQQLRERLNAAIKAFHDNGVEMGIDHPEVDIRVIWQDVLGGDAPEDLEGLAMYYELCANPVYPMPGVRRLLAACRRSGLKMGIVSNAQFYTPRILAGLLKTPLHRLGFDPNLLLFSYEMGVAKPGPTMFERAAHRLAAIGITVENALYLGNDMRNDIWPAAMSGFQTILFAGDNRSLRLRETDPAISACRPDAVVTHLIQVRKLINAVADPG